MGVSVRSVTNTNDLQDVVNQVNIANNEMTQDFNLLRNELALKTKVIDELKRDIDSLNVMLGEFSASKQRMTVNKRGAVKNLKMGESDESTIKTNTLFRATDGGLKWADDTGALTVIVP